MRSPLTNKSQNDQRFFFTENKIQLKNSTNNECKTFSQYPESKKPHPNIENMNQSFLRNKGDGSIGIISSSK